MDEQLLKDFLATAEANDYNWDTIMPKFPELANVDLQVLKDYTETAIQKNYDYDVVNPLFPELFSEDSLKKKDVSDSVTEDGLLESATTTTDTTSPTLNLEPQESSEAMKKIKANTLRLASGISRIPMYVAENAIGIAAMVNPELEYELQKMSLEEREMFIGSMAGIMPGTPGAKLAQPGNKVATSLRNRAEELEETMMEYDTGITEDIFSERFAQGFGRLLNEGVGAIPSLALAVTPGGIGLIGAGAAADKSRELQEKGDDLNLRTLINSAGSGVAEGIFEGVTRGLGKTLFKSLAGKTKDEALQSISKVFIGAAKGFGAEGASETATLVSQKALDAYVSKDEEAFNNIISEGLDTFLIGGVIGAPLGGLGPGFRNIVQGRQRKNLNEIIDKSEYKDMVDAFSIERGNKTIDISKLEILDAPNSKLFLEGTLEGEVKKNNITQADADKILNNYDQAASLKYQLAGLNLTPTQQVKVIPLLAEKKELEVLIDGKDPALVKKETNRINEINKQIEAVSEESDGATTLKEATRDDAIKALTEEGLITPSEQDIINKLDELNKTEPDADTIESSTEVLNEEQSDVSEAVVEGDNQPTELAGETTQAQEEAPIQPAQEGEVETEVPPSQIEEVLDEEVLVQEETDSKGRTFKRYATTTEKDGIKTTTYTFNRSDKDASQRNKSTVKPEVAFGERLEVDPESDYNDVIFENEGEFTVVGVENIIENPNPRSDQTQYQADVVVEIDGSRTTFKGIRLREKTAPIQADSKPSIEEVKQPTVPQQKKKARRARKNIKAGKMGPQPSTTLLTQLFTLDPSIIPDKQKQAYRELLNEVGERAAVLTLSEEQVIAPKAQQILNAVEEQVDTDDGAIAAKPDVDFDVPSESKRIADIKITVDPALDQDSKDLAKEINELTTEDIEGLVKIKPDGTRDVSQIKQLEKVKNNITKGYVPKKASELMIQVRSNKNADALIKPFTNLKRTKILENFRKAMFEIEKAISRPFGGIVAKNYISNRIRNNPKFQIDDILGNFNSKTIYNNTFRKLAEAFSSNETETKKLQAKIDAAYERIAKDKSPIERPHNDIVKDQYKLRLYQLQREHLSNPGNKKTPSAMDFLNITIDAALKGDVLSENDLKILQDLKKEFEVDGEIDNIKIEKSFSENQKKALKLLDEVNNSLAPKALFTSATIRGNKIDLLNDYSHHVILRDYNPSKEYFQQQQDRFVNQSTTKAGTLLERTAGAKPISFDPFLSATRGVQETLLDYHMTVPIRELQQTLNKLETKIKENPKSSNEDIMALKALRASVNESLETVFQSTFTDYSSTLFNKIRTLGYQAALASAPRAVAEFTSNLSFALTSNPEGFMDGVSKYMPIIENHELGINFMNNVGSTETNKLYNADELTGKYADLGLFKQVSSKKGQAKSQVNNIANYIAGFGGKQLAYYVNKLANNVLSAPDQWISRPLFMGEFAKTFKAETGITLTSDDMKAIAEGDSKYLGDEYKDAVEKSVISADKQSIQMATSKNPFNAIDKLQQKPGETTKNVWRVANGYMANFSLFEFTTARAAINALFNAGEISTTEAMGLLTGVTMRMTLYMVIYEAIIGQMDEAFGAPEDEDADEADELAYLTGRQLTGALTSLLTRGTLGNIPNIPITMGIEAFNEKYLQSLREDEEYDPFKHAIVFSAIGKEDVRTKDLTSLAIKSFAGPYGPLLKTADRTKKVATRALYNKTEKGRQDAKDELTERLSIEALGNIGLIPFYRDVRRIANKKFFDDKKSKKSDDVGKFSKDDLKRFKNNPAMLKIIKRQLKLEAERKKQIEKAQRKFKK